MRAQTEMSLIDNDVPSWALDRTGADGEYVEELDEAEAVAYAHLRRPPKRIV